MDTYSSTSIDHLGLISGICQDLDLVTTIDKILPCDDSKIVSHGECILAMLLNGLGFVNQALYLSPHFFSDKPVDKLIAPHIEATHLNDDALGRCLDAIYEFGASELYNAIVVNGLDNIGIQTRSVNMDITNLSVHGQYKQQSPEAIQITEGYSKDHRPDLKQLSLLLITSYKDRIPLLMKPLDGNAEETSSYKKVVDSMLSNLQDDLGINLLIFDAKGYTNDNLSSYCDRDIKWLSRVPASISCIKELIKQVDLSNMTKLDDNYSYQMFGNTYGGINQRWQLIYSKSLAKQKQKSTLKQFEKLVSREKKSCKTLSKQRFECQLDAENSYQSFKKTLKACKIKYYKVQVEEKHLKAGKPSKNAPTKKSFKLIIELEDNQAYKNTKLNEVGFFVLATNELDEDAISNKEILSYYKGQDGCEKGFRFIKDPKVVSTSINLKKNTRVEALLMVMTLCLLVYACLEYRIRQVLLLVKAFFPNQKGKPTQKPTARWVFHYFKNIQLLDINNQKVVINLNPNQKKLLDLMGDKYWQFYR